MEEDLKQMERIILGEEGPKSTLNYSEDGRYTYPERLRLLLEIVQRLLLEGNNEKD